MPVPARLRSVLDDLNRFPWADTVLTLRERFRDDRLGLTAGSLTFTTTIALVPLFTVALAIFTAFPMFGRMQLVLQRWLVDNLVPDAIARQVLGYLTQFSRQASQLGGVGLVFLLGTALALMLTIDRTLNGIWRVRRKRRLAQRLVVYWAALSLGPLLLGSSIMLTSYALGLSRGFAGAGWLRLLLDALQFLMIAFGAAAMYRLVPQTRVQWSHAWTGGLFVSIAIELARNLLVLYLAKVPTISVVYGTFATVPILLVWIYLVWVIVLLGAVIAAYLPSLLLGVARRSLGAGWRFQLALEILRLLHQARATDGRGQGVVQMARALRVSPLGIDSALQALVELDWVARLDEDASHAEPRYVLLADPERTALEPLVQALLLRNNSSTEALWERARLARLRLAEVL